MSYYVNQSGKLKETQRVMRGYDEVPVVGGHATPEAALAAALAECKAQEAELRRLRIKLKRRLAGLRIAILENVTKDAAP